MNNLLLYVGFIVLGLLAGYFSGLVGIGGGVIIVPALVLLFGFSQHTAQGTTLALLVPPIGLLAVWAYFRQGNVDVRAALFIALGFVIGGYLGGKLAAGMQEGTLRRIFALLLLLLGMRMLFS